MQKLRSFIRSEIFLLVLFSTVMLFLSFYYLFYHQLAAFKTGTYFPLIHNYNTDYNFYLSLIRQSSEGNWALITRYSPEIFPPRLTYLPYIAIGKFAALTNISVNLSYTLARLLLAGFFLYLIYVLIKMCYPNDSLSRKLALFLTVFGTSFWKLTQTQGELKLIRYLDFWTELNPLEKFVYLPHHLMGKLFLLLSFILIFKGISTGKIRLILFACLAGLISGLSSPYPLFNLEITFSVAIVLSIIFYIHRKKYLFNLLTGLIVFILISSLSLAYYYFLQHSTFPWNSYLTWEKTAYTVLPSALIFSLGPNFLFLLFALPHLISRKRPIDVLLVSWILTPFIGILFFAPFSLMANVRYLASAHFIPVGILAASGLNLFAAKISALTKMSKKFVLTLTIILLSSIYFPAIFENLQSQIKAFTPYYYNQFLPKNLLSAFAWLNTNTPANSVVLSQGYMANLIPAYSHNKAVTGHPNFTYDFNGKNQEISKFFVQNDPQFSEKFLEKYKISYIFFAQDTPPVNPDFVNKLSLKKIYSNEYVSIFEVIR